MSYPVTFEADYVERRSRLTAFFRLILAIPLVIWIYVYEIVALIAVVIAWFAIVITGRYPEGLYNFVAGFTRFLARMTAYTLLLVDPYPPFGGGADPAYPVRMEFAGPLAQYSRLKTFFRFILAIPVAILRYVLTLLLELGAVAAWFVIVITGKLPRGLFDLMVLANSYAARSDAYLFLLTQSYPPFQDEHTRSAGLAEASAFGIDPAGSRQVAGPTEVGRH
jgi:hypothetical protein